MLGRKRWVMVMWVRAPLMGRSRLFRTKPIEMRTELQLILPERQS